MQHGIYIGPDKKLRGQLALIRSGDDPQEVKAQFDSFYLGPSFSHNWTTYPIDHWGIYHCEDEDELHPLEEPLRF